MARRRIAGTVARGLALTALVVGALVVRALAAPTGGGERHPELDQLYTEFRLLIAGEIDRRDITDPADVYKFLYQGVMGPSHAYVSPGAALQWLENEWQQLPEPQVGYTSPTTVDSLPLIEPLCPDGTLVRLNLAPLWQLVTRDVPTDAWPDSGRHTRELVARTARVLGRQVASQPVSRK